MLYFNKFLDVSSSLQDWDKRKLYINIDSIKSIVEYPPKWHLFSSGITGVKDGGETFDYSVIVLTLDNGINYLMKCSLKDLGFQLQKDLFSSRMEDIIK